MTLPVAQPGDVCILVEPDPIERRQLHAVQHSLLTHYGGRVQHRSHFTCQRFSLPDPDRLPPLVQRLRAQLAAIPPLVVTASALELVEHPFWQFSVLRWDLNRSAALQQLAGIVTNALCAEELLPHYPSGPAWRPHVTALEEIHCSPRKNGRGRTHSSQYLFTGRRLVFSQVQPDKQFRILHTSPLTVPLLSPVEDWSPTDRVDTLE